MTVQSSESATEGVNVLSDEQRSALRQVLGKVPVIGLPTGGMGWGINPETDQQVLDIIAHMGEALGSALRLVESQREKMNAVDRDLAAFRRVIGTQE